MVEEPTPFYSGMRHSDLAHRRLLSKFLVAYHLLQCCSLTWPDPFFAGHLSIRDYKCPLRKGLVWFTGFTHPTPSQHVNFSKLYTQGYKGFKIFF